MSDDNELKAKACRSLYLAGHTQTAIADALGIPVKTVANYVHNERQHDFLYGAAKALVEASKDPTSGINLDDLNKPVPGSQSAAQQAKAQLGDELSKAMAAFLTGRR